MKKIITTLIFTVFALTSYASFWTKFGCYTVSKLGTINFTIEYDHNRYIEGPDELQTWVTIGGVEYGPITADTITFDAAQDGYIYSYSLTGTGLSQYNLNNPCLPVRIGFGGTGVICPCSCDANFCYTADTRNPFQYTFTYSDENFNYHQWDFGDGASTTGNLAIHKYSSLGAELVCQSVGEDVALCNRCIGVCPAPTYELVGSFGYGCNDNFSYTICTTNPAVVNFSADATSGNYNWDFGDGNTGTGATPTHTYTSSGNYQVCFTGGDGINSSCTLCMGICIHSTLPKIVPSAVANVNTASQGTWTAVPNPALDEITIENSGNGTGAGYLIFDVTGRIVNRGIITAKQHKIDISSLTPGMYIINLKSNDQVSNIKFNKQ